MKTSQKTASKRSKTSNFRPTDIPGIQSGFPAKRMPADGPVSLQQADTQLDSPLPPPPPLNRLLSIYQNAA